MFNTKVHAMRITKICAAALVLSAAGVLPAAHAAQSTVGVGTLTNGTTFSVRYVSDKFVAVNGTLPGTALGMDVHVGINTALGSGTDGATGIKNFSVWLKVHGQDPFGETSFETYKVTESNPFAADPFHAAKYGYLGYPSSQSADVRLNVPLSAMLQTAAARCNAKLSSLMASGMSREQAISQDQTITLAVQPVLRFVLAPISQTVTNESDRAWPEYRKINVLCQSPGPGPQARGTTSTKPGGSAPAGKGPALLTQVNLSLQQPPSPAQCPAEITAMMTFRASAMGNDAQPLAPGWFSYRVRSASGRVSKSDMVFFQESDRQGLVFVKTIQHKFNVPLPAMGGGGAPTPGLGGVAHGAAGGLASGGGGGGKAGPAAGAAGNFASGGAPIPSNVHADSLWVDITGGKAGSVQKSDYAAYNVTCQVTPTQTGVGGMVNKPDSRPTTHPTNPVQPAGSSFQLPTPATVTPTTRVPPSGPNPSSIPTGKPSSSPPATPAATPGTTRAAPSMPVVTRTR